MKRIAFYSREFRLCEWPEEPKQCTYHNRFPAFCEGSKKANGDIIPCRCKIDYQESEAVTSAMENGVEFEDQEQVRIFVCELNPVSPRTYQRKFKDGDNWDCPENVEIKEKCQHNGIHNSTCIYSKVAILKSESVEKKERLWDFKSTEEAKKFMRWYFKRYYAMKWEAIEIDLYNEVEAFRNQSTPKE